MTGAWVLVSVLNTEIVPFFLRTGAWYGVREARSSSPPLLMTCWVRISTRQGPLPCSSACKNRGLWAFWSNTDRPDTSQTDIKYIARYSLPNAWSIGFGPTISIDWEADSDDKWTVPVGLGVTKMVRFGKMPVKFLAEVNYSVVRPDTYGTEWKFIFRIAPVVPSPVR